MTNLVFLSTFLINICAIRSSFLSPDKNLLKAQLERNNIVNKGVWIKSISKDQFEKTAGDFIFRPNSLDVDNLLQNDFDAFGDSFMQGSPLLSTYVERAKRSSKNDEKERVIRDSLKSCNGEKGCIIKNLKENAIFDKAKVISKLRPTSVSNDYPYEVAILLGANKIDDSPSNIRKTKESDDVPQSVIPLNSNKDSPQFNIESFVNTESKVENYIKFNKSENVSGTPKRRIKNDFESEIIKKIEFTEEIDKIVDNSSNNKVDRNVFDKEERIWYQNNPSMASNAYNLGPKKNKPVNERGLIKVLSMLTKTFKKIMKQHSDIKKIHNKLHGLNERVVKNVDDISKKFTDIEQKYSYIVDVSGKMKEFESRLNLKDEYFNNKDREMSKNLLEFENQQKKFLTQQRQFYNIQKLMLAQNEKINIKQNLIAKMQSEISQKQNNFARILKKAKQIFIDNKHSSFNKKTLASSTPMPQPITIASTEEASITHTTTQSPYPTESIKINLFSIPSLNKLLNQDNLILKDKDDQNVDDLVYKYYFNNTFIDNLMKSKVFNSYANSPDNNELFRNEKIKRNDDILDSTLLLPVAKMDLDGSLNREKRWIRHGQGKSKLKRKLRGKNGVSVVDINDEKTLIKRGANKALDPLTKPVTKLVPLNSHNNNPFMVMANSFCNEIGQNTNAQVLSWCVEKALRRLQFLDQQITFPVPKVTDTKPQTTVLSPITVPKLNIINSDGNVLSRTPQAVSPLASSVVSQVPPSFPPSQAQTETATNIYFPDNDELELNLKQFDLKRDTEGTVYYDGSVHTSDIALDSDGGGFSDIMPGLESNSRVEMDPLTFDLHALRRRDPIRRLAEMNNIAYG